MQKHTKIWMDFFDKTTDEIVLCENCRSKATEIHHIDSKGMGGTSLNKDYIENLIALCRSCHEMAHGSIEFNQELKEVHLKYMERMK
ncbi:MAG: HNH endonuclease [Promethearchaeota archaeon]